MRHEDYSEMHQGRSQPSQSSWLLSDFIVAVMFVALMVSLFAGWPPQ